MDNEKLTLGDFAELGRMLKYIDRHDEEEIRATIKQEGEKEAETAKKNLDLADDLIEETTGESTNTETPENKENND
jgi:hypothetical protein